MKDKPLPGRYDREGLRGGYLERQWRLPCVIIGSVLRDVKREDTTCRAVSLTAASTATRSMGSSPWAPRNCSRVSSPMPTRTGA